MSFDFDGIFNSEADIFGGIFGDTVELTLESGDVISVNAIHVKLDASREIGDYVEQDTHNDVLDVIEHEVSELGLKYFDLENARLRIWEDTFEIYAPKADRRGIIRCKLSLV